jgi:flagellar basal-body rod protein FlgG
MLDDRQGDHFYTRSGSFYPDANHTLLHNPSGMTLAPPITLPADATASQVRADGVVLVQRPGIADWQEVGTIQIARFANPAALVTVGGGLYQSSSLSGPARLGRPANNGFGELKAGVLEK